MLCLAAEKPQEKKEGKIESSERGEKKKPKIDFVQFC